MGLWHIGRFRGGESPFFADVGHESIRDWKSEHSVVNRAAIIVALNDGSAPSEVTLQAAFREIALIDLLRGERLEPEARYTGISVHPLSARILKMNSGHGPNTGRGLGFKKE